MYSPFMFICTGITGVSTINNSTPISSVVDTSTPTSSVDHTSSPTSSIVDTSEYKIMGEYHGVTRSTQESTLAWIGRSSQGSNVTPGDGDCAVIAIQQSRLYYSIQLGEDTMQLDEDILTGWFRIHRDTYIHELMSNHFCRLSTPMSNSPSIYLRCIPLR